MYFLKCDLIRFHIIIKVSLVNRTKSKNTKTATKVFLEIITQDTPCPLMLYFPKLQPNNDDMGLISMRFWRNNYQKYISLLCTGSGNDRVYV